MINLIKIHNHLFKNSKTFKVFIIINILLFFLMLGILFTHTYCFFQIDEIINDEYNKNLILEINKNYDKFEEIYKKIQNKVSSISFNISIQNQQIGDNYFNIITDYEDFCINKLAIKVPKNNIVNENEFLDIADVNVIITDYDDNIIYCNQLLSKTLLEKGYYGTISLYIKDYKDINDIISQFKESNIAINSNNTSNNDLNIYSKVQNNLSGIFAILFILTIAILIFQLVQLFYEQKKAITIYRVIGINLSKIYFLYIYIILLYIVGIYVGNFILYMLLGSFLLNKYCNLLFFKYIIILLIIIIVIVVIETIIQFLTIKRSSHE